MQEMRAGVGRFRLPMTVEQATAFITTAYRNEVQWRHGVFLQDDETTAHIAAIARWLTDENPKFGLLLNGTCGNGKTTLVYAIRTTLNYLNRYGYIDAGGFQVIKARDLGRIMKTDFREFQSLCSVGMLAIDDLGDEPAEELDYGNVISPAIELLSHRYDRQAFTLVTSNLKPAQFRKKYGDRMADRFNEMMCQVAFENPSYRR